jgi:hypothetical protein
MPDETESIHVAEGAPFGVCLEYPSIEDVRHYTRNLGWEGRFEFVAAVPSLGTAAQRSYDIEHFVGTIAQRQVKSGSSPGNAFFIDLNKLITWIRDVVGDVSFAEALVNTVDPKDSNYWQIDAIRAIGINRLNQYFEVLEEAECSGETERAGEAECSGETECSGEAGMIPAQNREGE